MVLSDEDAASIFDNFALGVAEKIALDEELKERGDEPRHVNGPDVMATESLRQAFADMGDSVEGTQLFELAKEADPDAAGVVALPAFLAALQARRTWLLRQKQLARTKAAYAALGGTEDEATAIKSELLTAITSDFLGADAASSAIAGVVKHKMKAVAEVLAMGGELDSDEEAELKDTTKLEFDEVRAYLESVAGLAGSAAESAEVLR